MSLLAIVISLLSLFLGNGRAYNSPSFSNSFSSKSLLNLKKTSIYQTVLDVPTAEEVDEKVILITAKAMSHIADLKLKNNGNGCLRMGVRSGGCSGMSYLMDFIKEEEITEEDHIETYGDVRCVVDPKSLLYLYGLQLDYSDDLIGGGFKFSNPNAETAW
jgi:iron-sulfur cluster assembly protein